MLASHICAKIAVIPPPSGLFDGDILVWLPSSDGNFSVKLASISISHMDGAISDLLYKLIWKWCGLERIRLFLWLTPNESLHTNAFRFHRHLSNSPSCVQCNEDIHETVLHALRDCKIIDGFWIRLVPHEFWDTFSVLSLRAWLLENLKNHVLIDGRPWNYMFGSAIHFLW